MTNAADTRLAQTLEALDEGDEVTTNFQEGGKKGVNRFGALRSLRSATTTSSSESRKRLQPDVDRVDEQQATASVTVTLGGTHPLGNKSLDHARANLRVGERLYLPGEFEKATRLTGWFRQAGISPERSIVRQEGT